MSLVARAYIALVLAGGLTTLWMGLSRWQSQDLVRFGSYLIIAALSSRLKVRLPSMTGTMSVNFLFILIAVAEFSFGEALVVACVAMLAQSLLHTSRRPKMVQVLFSTASIAIATAAAHAVCHSAALRANGFQAPLVLLLSSVVFFLINTCCIAAVIAMTEGKPLLRIWKDGYSWSLAFYLVGAAVAAMFGVANRYLGWQAPLLVLPVVYLIHRSHHLNVERLEHEKRRAEEERKHAEDLAALHLRTIEALALAIEAKDQTTGDHVERVKVYAAEVGKDLGLNDEELEALRAAAVLHDIGKLAVPEHIISKPGRLTPEEFEKMKVHPVVGAEILEQVQFPYPVAPIVRCHHEKWDGSGYPAGLKGEEIPIGGRILAAVDCLDALASERQYRRALPIDEAMKVVQGESGKSFDPRVVEVLARRHAELERRAQTSTGQLSKIRLSTDLKIERGAAPAAGFESAASASVESGQPAQTLLELLRHLDGSSGTSEPLAALAAGLKTAVPYHALAVYLKTGDRLRPEYVVGENRELFASLAIPLGQGLSGWVAENRRSIVNGNPTVEPGYLNDPRRFSTLRSAVAIPLETGEGLVGVLTLYRAEKDAFSKEDLRLLEAIGGRVARALEAPVRMQAV